MNIIDDAHKRAFALPIEHHLCAICIVRPLVVKTNICLPTLLSFRCKDPRFLHSARSPFRFHPFATPGTRESVCAGCLLDHHPHRNARPSPEGGPAKPAKQGGVGVRVCRVETGRPEFGGTSHCHSLSLRGQTLTKHSHKKHYCGSFREIWLWYYWQGYPVEGVVPLCLAAGFVPFCFQNSGTGTDQKETKGKRGLCRTLIRWDTSQKVHFYDKNDTQHTSAWGKLRSLPNTVCG